ncbi:MAG: hypothetical protein LBO08_02325 [Rickettsiales bacterium]|jgi:hypothetical protein|nr:hypothetical protein [Rickettsiales bacterium]
MIYDLRYMISDFYVRIIKTFKGVKMIIMIISGITLFLCLALCVLFFSINSKVGRIARRSEHQYAVLVKMQSVLKSKYSTNAFAENAEMIYQNLLQHVIPIMAALDIMPRATDEHSLWRALGGISDEYAKNPFVLEQLRRAVKLDIKIANAADSFIARAEALLEQLRVESGTTILTEAFADGLLGQTIILFKTARQMNA